LKRRFNSIELDENNIWRHEWVWNNFPYHALVEKMKESDLNSSYSALKPGIVRGRFPHFPLAISKSRYNLIEMDYVELETQSRDSLSQP